MKATIPYIKVDILIWVVFRALGIISDCDIREHICNDMQDNQMLKMSKPCIDEGFVIQDREVCHLTRISINLAHSAYTDCTGDYMGNRLRRSGCMAGGSTTTARADGRGTPAGACTAFLDVY